MRAQLRQSVVMALLCMVLFGFGYALAGTGVSQLLFRYQADGSIGADGSTLIGQNWTSSLWFHGRPDDAGPYAHNSRTRVIGGDNPLVAEGVAGESGGTNLGPRSKALLADTRALVAYWHQRGVDPTPDLVTTSASGYDPDITQQDALVQIPMVAKATGLSPSTLRVLVERETHGAALGFLGSGTIDVLQLNRALATLR